MWAKDIDIFRGLWRRSAARHTIHFIQWFIHSPSQWLSSPFLPPPLPPAVAGVRGEGEGQQAMIMQQAAVLHPVAGKHTHTRWFSSFSTPPTNTHWTWNRNCRRTTPPRPNPSSPPLSQTHAEAETAPSQTLHCQPVFLSLPLLIALFFFFSSSPFSCSLRSADWIPAVIHAPAPPPRPASNHRRLHWEPANQQ